MLKRTPPPCPLQVKTLIDKIYAIPDGLSSNRRPFKVRVCDGTAQRMICSSGRW